jgi:hypothetical protein
MNIEVSLPLQIHGFHKRFSFSVLQLFHGALFHAKEHHIVLLYVFLINNVHQAVSGIGLESLTLSELQP